MVLLRTLNLPALTANVLRFLASRHVLTVEDFLVHDTEVLASEAGQSLVAAEFNEATEAMLSYLEKLQGPWSLGSELLEEDVKLLPINCGSVDSLLGGGLREGSITELVGESSTGKTQASASVVHRFHSGVIYVDTCNSFSARRVVRILEKCSGYKIKEGEHDYICLGMRGYFFVRDDDITSLVQIAGGDLRLRLLVIDSASSLVSPVLGAGNSRGHSLMMCLARCLKKLAAEKKIAVMITNHTVTRDDCQLQPALGESWTSVPHVRLWLTRDSSSGICTVSIIKHTSLACNKQASFSIGTDGLASAYDTSFNSGSSSPSL